MSYDKVVIKNSLHLWNTASNCYNARYNILRQIK